MESSLGSQLPRYPSVNPIQSLKLVSKGAVGAAWAPKLTARVTRRPDSSTCCKFCRVRNGASCGTNLLVGQSHQSSQWKMN